MLQPFRRHLEAVVRDRDRRSLARCLLSRGRYVIGQDRKNEIVIDEPSVSSAHARLTVVSEEEFLVEDLGSANGTLVNGEPADGRRPVTLEDRIELGSCTLAFQRGGLPAAVFQSLPPGFLREHRYDFGEAVVEGRTSTIFAAHDTSLGRDIALKVLRPECQADPAHVLRFVREAQITSQLPHPGILPIYELNLDEQSRLFYTTRFVEGESLETVLDALHANQEGTAVRYPLPALLSIFQKVCDAVAFAHSRGVLHCGLRSAAVTIGRFGETFVTHWGAAKATGCDAAGQPVVSPVQVAPTADVPAISPYTAPEQSPASPGELTAATDVFALGAILYRILTLRPPIFGDSEEELVLQMIAGAIQPPHAVVCGPLAHLPGGRVPDALSAIAFKALATAPEGRFPNVPKMQRLITAWQNGLASDREHGLWKQVSGLLGRP